MSDYGITCQPVVVSQLTGDLGAATATYRGCVYNVPLHVSGVRFAHCTRDESSIAWDSVPRAVQLHAIKWWGLLMREYLARIPAGRHAIPVSES